MGWRFQDFFIIKVNNSNNNNNNNNNNNSNNNNNNNNPNFNIQTDHVIKARRPDMIVVEKVKKTCTIIDFAIPYNSRVNNKEMERIEKYQDLARELRKLWNMKVKLGYSYNYRNTLGTTPIIGIETRVKELQKTVTIHSARIEKKGP